jgi:hypothetical protein
MGEENAYDPSLDGRFHNYFCVFDRLHQIQDNDLPQCRWELPVADHRGRLRLNRTLILIGALITIIGVLWP